MNQNLSAISAPIPSGQGENLLVDGLRKRDESTFYKFYKDYEHSLFAIIVKIVRDKEVAKDILQDTFVQIFNKINMYDSTKGRLYTWIARLARNRSIDHLRASRIVYENISDLKEEQFSCLQINCFNIETIGIKTLSNMLSSSHKQVIDLLYFQGYTHTEAAEELQMPLGTLKTKSRSATILLRREFYIKNVSGC